MQNRLFIAISYESNSLFLFMQKRIVSQLQALFAENNCFIRLQEHIHNTLFFLGSRSEDAILEIKNKCDLDIQKHIKKYGLGTLKTYSSRIHFQILGHGVIVAVLEPNELLSNLYTLFEHSFGKAEEHETRSFLPHITLARIKKLTKSNYDKVIKEASVLLHELDKEFMSSFALGTDSLILFSSDQGHYTQIAQFAL